MDLIHSDKKLTFDEKIFCYENYNESATSNVRELGSFHTPLSLAWDFYLDAYSGNSVVDLCAGIGILAFCFNQKSINDYPKRYPKIVCVEYSKEYCEIGKRLLPEAIWVNDDALTHDVLQYLDPCTKFDAAISNPPFGSIKTSAHFGKFKGQDFDLRIVERASEVAHYGAFILPPTSVPFQYSGCRFYQEVDRPKYIKFNSATGISLEAGVGIDTSYHREEWKNTNIVCEVARAEFTKEPNRMKSKLKLMRGDVLTKLKTLDDNSVDLVFFHTTNKRWSDPVKMSDIFSELQRIKTENGIIITTAGHKMDSKTIRRLIKANSSKGSVILNPYMLRGEVGVACAKLGRKFIGIEEKDLYYDICKSLLVDAYNKAKE